MRRTLSSFSRLLDVFFILVWSSDLQLLPHCGGGQLLEQRQALPGLPLHGGVGALQGFRHEAEGVRQQRLQPVLAEGPHDGPVHRQDRHLHLWGQQGVTKKVPTKLKGNKRLNHFYPKKEIFKKLHGLNGTKNLL